MKRKHRCTKGEGSSRQFTSWPGQVAGIFGCSCGGEGSIHDRGRGGGGGITSSQGWWDGGLDVGDGYWDGWFEGTVGVAPGRCYQIVGGARCSLTGPSPNETYTSVHRGHGGTTSDTERPTRGPVWPLSGCNVGWPAITLLCQEDTDVADLARDIKRVSVNESTTTPTTRSVIKIGISHDCRQREHWIRCNIWTTFFYHLTRMIFIITRMIFIIPWYDTSLFFFMYEMTDFFLRRFIFVVYDYGRYDGVMWWIWMMVLCSWCS